MPVLISDHPHGAAIVAASLAHIMHDLDASCDHHHPEQDHGRQVVPQPDLRDGDPQNQRNDDTQIVHHPIGPLGPDWEKPGQPTGDHMTATLPAAGAFGTIGEQDGSRTAGEKKQVCQSPKNGCLPYDHHGRCQRTGHEKQTDYAVHLSLHDGRLAFRQTEQFR